MQKFVNLYYRNNSNSKTTQLRETYGRQGTKSRHVNGTIGWVTLHSQSGSTVCELTVTVVLYWTV